SLGALDHRSPLSPRGRAVGGEGARAPRLLVRYSRASPFRSGFLVESCSAVWKNARGIARHRVIERKRIVCMGIRIAAVILLSLVCGCGKNEPTHNGKTVSAWRDQLSAKEPGARREAALAMWSIGEGAKLAVPDLVVCLKDADDEVRLNAAGALGETGPHEG